jgi:hypothetical protein
MIWGKKGIIKLEGAKRVKLEIIRSHDIPPLGNSMD